MDEAERNQRLERDRQGLRELMEESSILQAIQDPTDRRRWRWIFHGKGHLPTADSGQTAIAERHEIEVLLPFDYPQTPPEMRCQTPTFHPCIAADGEITVSDLGLAWEGRWGLEVICERLWDVLRGAYFPEVSLQRRPAAERYFESLSTEQRLVDPRPLRDRPRQRPTNIFRYRPLFGRAPVGQARDREVDLNVQAGSHNAMPPRLNEIRSARSPADIVFLDVVEPGQPSLDEREIVFLDEASSESAVERGRQ